MEYFYSIMLGLVQAITEFLPISSSGHLIIVHRFVPSGLLDSLTYDVMLHFGTLLALIVFFWRDLERLSKAFFRWIFYNEATTNSRLAINLIVATIPAGLAGYFFGDLIEQKFRSVVWVALALVGVGTLFIIFEKFSSKKNELPFLNVFHSIVIGIAQVLAFMPGVSRSGIVILAGLGFGLARKEAARFSFLMAVPIIFLASLKEITQFTSGDFSFNFVFIYILGAVVSAVFGYVVIKYFLIYLEKHSLIVFAIYRFVLAGFLFILFIL